MTTPAKRDANRNNAKKSTGPRTAEGKARSSRNAVTHGLTARPAPGEPTEAFRATLAEWVAELRPRGIVERTLAERACRAAWNLGRCDRFEDATSAKRLRDAAEVHDLAEAARAEALGRRLLAMPAEVESEDGRSIGAYARPGEEDAAALVGELRRTAAGVSWLLARWNDLGRALKEPEGWGAAERFAAARFLGLRDGDGTAIGPGRPRAAEAGPSGGGSWLDAPAIGGALEAAVAAGEEGRGDPKGLWLDCLRAVASRPRGDSAAGAAEAKRLGALVRSERAKLARRMRAVLKDRAAEDRAGAADRAMFEESRALSLCLRYATAASRDLHRSIADLAKLRESGSGDGEPGDGGGPGDGEGGDGPGPVGGDGRGGGAPGGGNGRPDPVGGDGLPIDLQAVPSSSGWLGSRPRDPGSVWPDRGLAGETPATQKSGPEPCHRKVDHPGGESGEGSRPGDTPGSGEGGSRRGVEAPDRAPAFLRNEATVTPPGGGGPIRQRATSAGSPPEGTSGRARRGSPGCSAAEMPAERIPIEPGGSSGRADRPVKLDARPGGWHNRVADPATPLIFTLTAANPPMSGFRAASGILLGLRGVPLACGPWSPCNAIRLPIDPLPAGLPRPLGVIRPGGAL